MDVRVINAFIDSANSVFETMLNCRLEQGEPAIKDRVHPEFEVSGMIGLSGKSEGTVVVSFERATAMAITKTFLGVDQHEINEDVVDAVGELVNMVAGSAKSELTELEMSMGLPTVIIGKNKVIQFPSRVMPIRIPFDCELGELCVDVGIAQKQLAAVGG